MVSATVTVFPVPSIEIIARLGERAMYIRYNAHPRNNDSMVRYVDDY